MHIWQLTLSSIGGEASEAPLNVFAIAQNDSRASAIFLKNDFVKFYPPYGPLKGGS